LAPPVENSPRHICRLHLDRRCLSGQFSCRIRGIVCDTATNSVRRSPESDAGAGVRRASRFRTGGRGGRTCHWRFPEPCWLPGCSRTPWQLVPTTPSVLSAFSTFLRRRNMMGQKKGAANSVAVVPPSLQPQKKTVGIRSLRFEILSSSISQPPGSRAAGFITDLLSVRPP